MSKTKKRAMIESDTDDSGSSEVEQVCEGGEIYRYTRAQTYPSIQSSVAVEDSTISFR